MKLAVCAGTRTLEMSLEAIDVGQIHRLENSGKGSSIKATLWLPHLHLRQLSFRR